jgi:hypothetical protein
MHAAGKERWDLLLHAEGARVGVPVSVIITVLLEPAPLLLLLRVGQGVAKNAAQTAQTRWRGGSGPPGAAKRP